MSSYQADCNGSDNELSEQSYVQSRSMRDRPVSSETFRALL